MSDRQKCPECGKNYSWRSYGSIRTHASCSICEDGAPDTKMVGHGGEIIEGTYIEKYRECSSCSHREDREYAAIEQACADGISLRCERVSAPRLGQRIASAVRDLLFKMADEGKIDPADMIHEHGGSNIPARPVRINSQEV